MRQKQILKNGLVCAGEHLECENYAADKQTLLRVVNLKAGDYYFRDKTEHSTLVFLLSGELELSMGYTINQKVVGGQMYLIPAGERQKQIRQYFILFLIGKCLCVTSLPLHNW